MGAYAFRCWIFAPCPVRDVLGPHNVALDVLIRLRIPHVLPLIEKVP